MKREFYPCPERRSLGYTPSMAIGSPRKCDIPPEHAEALRVSLRHYLGLWQLEELEPEIELRISSRMTRTIGSAHQGKNRITFAIWLFNQPTEIIEEVVCHEAAHLAASTLYGPGIRPHGREWQALMRKAGVAPRVRIPVPHAPPVAPIRSKRRRSALGRMRDRVGAVGGLLRLRG